MGERYVEFDELHGLKDVISDLRISRDITTSEGTGTLFSNSGYQLKPGHFVNSTG